MILPSKIESTRCTQHGIKRQKKPAARSAKEPVVLIAFAFPADRRVGYWTSRKLDLDLHANSALPTVSSKVAQMFNSTGTSSGLTPASDRPLTNHSRIC